MTFIMKAMMKTALKSEIAQLDREEIKISQQISDLSNYASAIGDGVLTVNELASAPSSLFGTTLSYLANSSQMAYQSATTKTNAIIQQLSQSNGATGNQYGYAISQVNGGQYNAAAIFNQVYQEELKEYAKQMQDVIDNYEEELETEHERIKTQLQLKHAQMESYDQAISDGIRESAPKFA